MREQAARAQAKARRIRKDFLHKTSKSLAEKAGAAVALEDLKVAQMVRRPKAKPVVDGEGNVVRFERNRAAQKAGLNKAILNVGWGDFRTLIEYKLRERNKFLATVSPQYTSQECSKCAHVDAGNRRTQEHFQCLQCGHTDNADTNASQVIKKRFLTQLRNGTLPPKGKASKKIAARRKPGAVTPTEVRCQPVEPCVRLGSNPERGLRSRKRPLAREACSG
jgi:transposase